MRARLLSLLVLLASGSAAQGRHDRRLLQDESAYDQCSDLSVLIAELPEASEILEVIKELGILSAGIPANTTIFLPSNEAAALLPADLELPFTLETVQRALPALGPEIKNRLISTILYHIAPIGALDDATLAAASEDASASGGISWDIPTSLRDPGSGAEATVRVTDTDPAAPLVITDASGRRAVLAGGPSRTALEACDAAVWVIDQVLLPADDLFHVPKTSKAAAQSILYVDGIEDEEDDEGELGGGGSRQQGA